MRKDILHLKPTKKLPKKMHIGQLHYHLAPAGVRVVIENSIDSILQYFKGKINIFVIANAWAAPKPEDLRIRPDFKKFKNVSIKTIYVKNRSVQKCVCSNAEGYTFCKAAGALMFGGETSHSFLFGEIKNDVYRVIKVSLPEMVLDRPEKRNIEDYKNLLIKGSKEIEEIQT